MANLTLQKVDKIYGPVQVLHGIDLDFQGNPFIVFVGPSGCGKSTLLRAIAGLEDCSAGKIFIDNVDVTDMPPVDRDISMVFQSYALYPQMTVEENMSFGLRMAKVEKSLIDQKVHAAAKLLKLDKLLHRKPKDLSGGQRQRVAIGRSIVRSPKIFLFDEPLSNLDAELRVEMRIQIAKLHAELQSTMIYVTHDQVEAMTLATLIVVLRDGRVEQVGSPLELYEYPQNQFVAGFIGSPKMNFVDVVVKDITEDVISIQMPGGEVIPVPRTSHGVKVGDELTLGLRPEHLLKNKGDVYRVATKVDFVENLGSISYLYVKTAELDRVVVQRANYDDTKQGDALELLVRPSKCYLFRKDGQAILANRP